MANLAPWACPDGALRSAGPRQVVRLAAPGAFGQHALGYRDSDLGRFRSTLRFAGDGTDERVLAGGAHLLLQASEQVRIQDLSSMRAGEALHVGVAWRPPGRMKRNAMWSTSRQSRSAVDVSSGQMSTRSSLGVPYTATSGSGSSTSRTLGSETPMSMARPSRFHASMTFRSRSRLRGWYHSWDTSARKRTKRGGRQSRSPYHLRVYSIGVGTVRTPRVRPTTRHGLDLGRACKLLATFPPRLGPSARRIRRRAHPRCLVASSPADRRRASRYAGGTRTHARREVGWCS